MSSMSSVIKQHNYRVLSTTENVDRLRNCRNKETCSLNNKCLQTCIVYNADVITNKDSHIYYGASDGAFKSRYSNHTNSFGYRHQKQDTELSKPIWKLQDRGIDFKVNHRSLCLNIEMWVKKVCPMFNGELRDSKS